MKKWAPLNCVTVALVFAAVLCGLWNSEVAGAAVGRTPGNSTVTATGSFQYNIPIWAPPGPHGLQPNIALTYDSRQSMGYVGVGWGLSGLSSIYRCNQTFAQDPAPGPVTLTQSDVFCMDGQRLRLTSGTYGAAGSTYQTEVANFSNVTANGTAGNGPATFSVQGSDGRTYEYGNGGNSQVIATGTSPSTASQWLLDKVTDPAGNTMTIIYQEANQDSNLEGTTVPEVISWTPSSQGARSYNYTMTFKYQIESAPLTTGYLAGTTVQNAYLLTNIVVQSSGTTVKNYVLSYTPSTTTARETLTSIQECADSAASNCLAATTIGYQPGAAGVTTSSATALTSAPTGLVAHYDFNGDGYNDLAYCNGGSPNTVDIAFGSASGYGAPLTTGIACGALGAPLYGDLLGSGTDGILADNGGTWYYYTWNGSSFTGVSTGLAYDSTAHSYVLADVNGDGLPDLVSGYQAETTINLYTRLNTGSGSAASFSSTNTLAYQMTLANVLGWVIASNTDSQYSSSYGTLRSFDFNGDGRKDLSLALLHASCGSGGCSGFYATTYELLSQGSTFSATEIASVAGESEGVTFLNFNGDACTDYLTSGVVYVSGCDGTVTGAVAVPTGTVIGAMDWNGDGLADVLVENGSTIGVYPSTGVGFSSLISTSIPYSSSSRYFTFDANGDGLTDLGVWSTSTPYAVTYYLHNGAGQPPDLLSGISDGYGNSASPTYVSMVQSHYSNYTYSSAVYPYRLYLAPFYVVSNVTFSDPTSLSNGTYSQTYYYIGSWTNLQGRGFSNFMNVERYDSRNQVWELDCYENKFPFSGRHACTQLSLDQAGNQLIRVAFGNHAATTLDGTANNQRYFPYYSQWTDQSYQVSWSATSGNSTGPLIGTSLTSYSYDNFGNPTTVSTTVTDNDSNSPYFNDTWTTTTTNTPDANPSTGCLRLLSQSRVSFTSSVGSTVPTLTKQFMPDTTNCRYTQIVTAPGSAYQVTEAIGYDEFGNVTSDAVTGAGMGAASPATRTTTLTWYNNTYPTGQFPLSAQDPSGATTQFTYNYSYGLPASNTDPNGETTSWQYDSFGRKTQETRPDGTSTSITYNGCAPPNTCQPLWRSFVWIYALDTQGNTINQLVRVYDALDRQLEVSTRALNSTVSQK
jgi:YD repeat-containing protein